MLRRVLFAAIALSGLAAPVSAEPACLKRSEAIRQLSFDYDESPIAFGLAPGGRVVEIFASRNRATWTILVTLPNGLSCLIAAGDGWETVLPAVANGPGV